jgi:hypothetical protein
MQKWCEKEGKVPVVIFAFNRPNLLRELLNQVILYDPPHLLVVLDGPRDGNENDTLLVQQCLLLAKGYSGQGELVIDASPFNLGLAERFSSGLSLASRLFSKFMVLEDDCLPNKDFFEFCENLLHRYENEPRVGMIQGGNLHPWGGSIHESYTFSDRPRVWGWATWASRVEGFDATKWDVSRSEAYKVLRKHGHGVVEAHSKAKQFANALAIGTWDFQWVYRLWEKDMFAACPRSNLIQNLGFGAEATHTKFESIVGSKAAEPLLFPLSHPEVIAVSRSFDRSETLARRIHVLIFTLRNPLVVLERLRKYFEILGKSRK